MTHEFHHTLVLSHKKILGVVITIIHRRSPGSRSNTFRLILHLDIVVDEFGLSLIGYRTLLGYAALRRLTIFKS